MGLWGLGRTPLPRDEGSFQDGKEARDGSLLHCTHGVQEESILIELGEELTNLLFIMHILGEGKREEGSGPSWARDGRQPQSHTITNYSHMF
jgi:hypothetical protein